MMTHLKYLAVGGAITCAGLGAVLAFSSYPFTIASVAIAYGLGWSYYYRKRGQ